VRREHQTDTGVVVSYPVTFSVEYQERRSRLSTFFRILLCIPIFIWLALWAILTYITVIIAWFVIVITGRYPTALYNFNAGFLTVATQATGYSMLLCDGYPPFAPGDGNYPIQMGFDGPLPKYSRLLTFFRFILAIPIMIIRYVLTFLMEIAALFGWFVIVITGRCPRGLFDMMVLAGSYIARSDAYLLLLTQTYPPFQDETTRTAGIA
jgi:Domain of unknown function (DUF4389)